MESQYIDGRVFNYHNCLGGTALAGKGFFFPSDFALGSNGSLYVLNKAIEFNPSMGISKVTRDHEFVWEDRGLNYIMHRGPLPKRGRPGQPGKRIHR